MNYNNTKLRRQNFTYSDERKNEPSDKIRMIAMLSNVFETQSVTPSDIKGGVYKVIYTSFFNSYVKM